MERMTAEEIRKVQLDMLEAFAAFCKENDLRYFLDAGSLLGAIRHNGFIPWDDDIDLGMPRVDYEKAIALGKNGFGGHYRIMTAEEGIHPMAKVIDTRTLMIEFPKKHRNKIAVYLDLFPKDGVADFSKKSYRICKKVDFLGKKYWFYKMSIYTWKHAGNALQKAVAWFFRLIMTEKRKYKPLKKIDKLSKRLAFDEAPYVATIIAGGMQNCVPRACLETYTLHTFEHLQVNVPVGYDEYLRTLYSNINGGDYMQLPPEDKRVKHDNEAYWLTEDEREKV